MAWFKAINRSSGVSFELPVEASANIVKGNAIDFDGGYAQNATSSSTHIKFVAAEDANNSSGSDGDIVVNAYLAEGIVWECETNSTAAQTMVGTFIDLTDANTLNEAASTTDVFFVTEFVDASTLRGIFVQKTS